MDLSEALSFNKTDIAAITPPSSPSLIRNKAGLTHVCSNESQSALFHYSPISNTLSLYNTITQTDTDTDADSKYILASQFQTQDVVHIASSHDGRLILLVHSNSSISCINVTMQSQSQMQLRWVLQDIHSHSKPYGHASSKRSHGGVNRGPIHSVSFSPTNYDCIIGDAYNGLFILDCQAGGIKRTIPIDAAAAAAAAAGKILSADWGDNGTIIVGLDTGMIAFVNQENQFDLIVPDVVRDDEQDINWSCTHVQCFNNHYVAVGLCRIFPEGDEDEEDDKHDNGEEEEDDEADHEANLLIYDTQTKEWTELGDVVAFFAVPKYARHAFYTLYLPKQELLLVACNVTSEIGVVAHMDGIWQICELQEGNAATAPITVDDEFTFPTGIACVVDAEGKLNIAVGATDGSVIAFELEHVTHDGYGLADAMGKWTIENDCVEMTVLENDNDDDPQLVDEPAVDYIEPHVVHKESAPMSSPAFGGGTSTRLSFGSGTSTPSLFGSGTAKPVFGSSSAAPASAPFGGAAFGSPSALVSTKTSTPFGSTMKAAPFGGAAFGSPSALGSTSSSTPFGSAVKAAPFGSTVFGSPSALGSTSTSTPFVSPTKAAAPASSAAFGSSSTSFGLSSAKFGAFSLAPPTTDTAAAPALSENEKNAPIFGSGSKQPAFGSSPAPSFGTTTSSGFGALATGTGGFGSLAAKAGDKKGFGFLDSAPSSFGATGSSSKAAGDITTTKPQFGQSSTNPVGATQTESNSSPTAPFANNAVVSQTAEPTNIIDAISSTSEAKHAANGFDAIDQDKQGKIPIDQLEDLLDQIGEGFHGDELDKQLAILDPNDSGFIDRAAFIEWYCKLGNDSDDGGSLDTEERAEREEEKTKAIDAFQSVATEGSVDKDDFGKLMGAMGTTYCEEEHRRTIKKISDDDGDISQEAFVSWYMDWLFGDGDESEYSDDDEQSHPSANIDPNVSSGGGWGSMFTVDDASWKCDACMLRNKQDASKCAACETVRPGHEEKQDAKGELTNKSGEVGSSGFTFSAAGTGGDKGSDSNSTGFSFGFKAPAPAASGGLSLSAPPVDMEASTAPAGGGFSFGFKAPESEPTSGSTKDTSAPASSQFELSTKATLTSTDSTSAFPPMSAKAPTPFVTTVKEVTSSNSSAFPPMSTKAPTPFGGAAKPSAKPATSSAFPPMSVKAPTPFGGAAKPATSSAFPPMSVKAPTPFGGAAKPATSSSTSSAFPPMSVKAPTPFGGVAKPTRTAALAIHPMSTNVSASKPTDKSYLAASEYEAQFWTLLKDHDKLLLEVKTLSSTNVALDFQREVERIVESIEKLNSDKSMMDSKICSSKELSILLLSRKDDLERQLEESKQILTAHVDRNDLIEDSASKSYALDLESEKTRRRLVNKALSTQKCLARLNDAVKLLNSIVRKPASTQASVFSWTPSRHAKRTVETKGPKVIFEHLKTGYDRTKRLEDTAKSLHCRVEEYSRGSDDSALVAPKPLVVRDRRGRRKITALPFSSPTSFAKSFKSHSSKGLSAVEALQSLKQCHHVNPKQFEVRHLHMHSVEKESNTALPSWRSNNSSQLMGLSSPMINTSSSTMAQLQNVNRALATSEEIARTGWTSTDVKAMELAKLSMPTSLQHIDAGKAAKEALVPFGVTPEKMSTVRKTLRRGLNTSDSSATVKSFATSTVSTNTAATVGTKKSSSASFPPMSSKAPTPFGGQQGSGKAPLSSGVYPPMSKSPKPFASKPESKQATALEKPSTDANTSSSAFPPMSSKAPTPFGNTASAKTEEPKKEDQKPSIAGNASLSFAKQSEPKEANTPKESKGTGLFGTMGALGSALGDTGVEQSPFGSASSAATHDYKDILTKFYQTHNNSKVSEVEKTLQKYKGQEAGLFEKLAQKYKVQNPLQQGSSKSSAISSISQVFSGSTPVNTLTTNAIDYSSILTNFYQNYNPSKVGEVSRTLAKYKGHEKEMFSKLAKKYNVPDPLLQDASVMSAGSGTNAGAPSAFASSGGFGSTPAVSTFGGASPFGTTGGATQSPFGGTSKPATNGATQSPFGGTTNPATSGATQSPFGGTSNPVTSGATQSPFGGAPAASFSSSMNSSTPFGSSSQGFGKPASSSFGQSASAASPFGQSTQPAASPFGQATAPSLGSTSTAGGGATFGGKTAREILFAFYQQRNPSKISDVDKLLTKYAGKEEQLFRNLAKKYNLDPSIFGLSAASTSAFLAPSPIGQSSAFGQAAPAGGGFGGVAQSSGFSSFGQASQNKSGGFGTLPSGNSAGFGSSAPAPAPAGNSFGNNAGFGASPAATPFGAARR